MYNAIQRIASMPRIPLNQDQVLRVKGLAKEIADRIQNFIDSHSSVSTERTILRLFGIDGTNDQEIPLPNRIVDLLREQNLLEQGISFPFSAACLKSRRDTQTTAEMIDRGEIILGDYDGISISKIREQVSVFAAGAIELLDSTRQRKQRKREQFPMGAQPWKYLIVATGNIFEDRTQAISAVHCGADVIAVIRTTAQSLLDHVPYGATTEGWGGTMATQENFRIMRKSLDEASEQAGRYVMLTNYSSGLCMAEIAACAAIEDLDMLLNDSMYGILFRDINMQRTFIDQYFSRMICASAKIVINTGEDNYLTTSDAIEQAHTVTASQLINEAMARNALITDEIMGLGHAFEISPNVPNAFLYELAHAQLARELFPNAPLKYMPPTKHKSTDIFFSHSMDTLFNLASVTTGQGIHLAGILSEAIHTPLMQERFKALQSINYVFGVARELGDEIEWKEDGFIVNRAKTVLGETEKMLEEILELGGLRKAIEAGKFANIIRTFEGGKGFDGVFLKAENYSNPVMEILSKEGVIV